jgi:hypothetical protein
MKYKIKDIEKFIIFIKSNAPVESTNKYLRETFFNNNKEVSSSVFKKLKESGVLMTNKSYSKGRGQTWYYLDNKVDLADLFNEPVNQEPVNQEPVNQEPVNQEPVNQEPVNDVEIITNEYGHFIIEKPKHYNVFKQCLKITESTFGSIWHKAVIEECLINGLSNDQAEYLWLRYERYKSKQHKKTTRVSDGFLSDGLGI